MAKSLIFLPMAISFVGAGIIWRFMYQSRDIRQDQTGVLNAVWVWLGEVSTSDTGKWIAVIVLGVIAVALGLLVYRGVTTGGRRWRASRSACSYRLLLIYRFIGPGLGGFVEVDGEVRANPSCSSRTPRSTTCG